MRVSGCGYAARSLEEAKALSKAVTEVTHNHPEGLKGAESVAVAVFLARTGKNRTEIREHITKNYYPIDFTMDSIRGIYSFNETCQNTVPQALEAFFESDGFEDAIRNAISVGGDSDTLAEVLVMDLEFLPIAAVPYLSCQTCTGRRGYVTVQRRDSRYG